MKTLAAYCGALFTRVRQRDSNPLIRISKCVQQVTRVQGWVKFREDGKVFITFYLAIMKTVYCHFMKQVFPVQSLTAYTLFVTL